MSSLQSQSNSFDSPEGDTEQLQAPQSEALPTSALSLPAKTKSEFEKELLADCECLDAEAAADAVAIQQEKGKLVSALQIAEYHLDEVLSEDSPNREDLAHAHILLADCYDKLGLFDSALPFWEQAVELTEVRGQPPSLRLAEMLAALSGSYALNRKFPEAYRTIERAEQVYSSLTPDQSVVMSRGEALLAFGEAFNRVGSHDDAVRQLRNALGEIAKFVGAETPLHQQALRALGEAYLHTGNAEAAASVFDAMLNGAIRGERPPGAQHFFAHAGLAQASHIATPQSYELIADFAELALRTFDMRDKTQRPVAALMQYYVARARSCEGGPEPAAARGLLERAFVLSDSNSAASQFFQLQVLDELAGVYEELSEPDREAWAHDRLVSLAAIHYGPAHPQALRAREDRLDFLMRVGRWKDALPAAEGVTELVRTVHGPQSREHAQALRDWSFVCAKNRLFVEGEDLLKTASRIAKVLSDNELRIEIYDDLGIQRTDSGDYAGAARAFLRAFILSREERGERDPQTLEAQAAAADAHLDADMPQEAFKLARAAARGYEALEDRNAQALALSIQGSAAVALGRYEDGVGLLRRAHATVRRTSPDNADALAIARRRALAEVEAADFYGTRERFEDALSVIKGALQQSERLNGSITGRLELLESAIDLCERLDLDRDCAIFRRQRALLEKRLGSSS